MQVQYAPVLNIQSIEITDALKEEVFTSFEKKQLKKEDFKSFDYFRNTPQSQWPPILMEQFSDLLKLIDGRHRIFIAVEKGFQFIQAVVKDKT